MYTWSTQKYYYTNIDTRKIIQSTLYMYIKKATTEIPTAVAAVTAVRYFGTTIR